jgi:hypothetical protein
MQSHKNEQDGVVFKRLNISYVNIEKIFEILPNM